MKAFVILSAMSMGAFANELVKRADTTTTITAETGVSSATGLPLSDVSYLLTVIPSSLLALAATNAPSASAFLASELANSETLTWLSALPTSLQTYFLVTNAVTTTPTPTAITQPSNITLGPGPVITSATPVVRNTTVVILPSYTTYSNGSSAVNGTTIANNGTTVAGGNATMGGYNSTMSRTVVSAVTTTNTVTGSSLRGAASSASASLLSAASSTLTGAAALPTKVVGAAVVGAMGVLGMLVL